jgi:site-specific DNA recombinase
MRLLLPGERCPARYIPARPLEDLVWRDLCEALSAPEMVAQAMQRARGGHWLPQEWQARRASMRRGRAALGQHLERLTEAYLAGVVPLAEYERRRRDIDARLTALERQEQDLVHGAERQDETAQLAAHAEAFCRRVREGLAEADFERKRALLELLVDRVVVTDGAVEIRYVVPTGPEGEHAPFSRLRTDYRNRGRPLQGPHRTEAARPQLTRAAGRGRHRGRGAQPHDPGRQAGFRSRRLNQQRRGACHL